MLTQERLQEVLDYNKETGLFTWKINRLNANIGDEIKLLKIGNTYCIHIDGVTYSASNLAWLFQYGEYPQRVRHIDYNTKNNKINNLFDYSKKENNYMLSQDDLKKVLLYSPYTGDFLWKVAQAKAPVWSVAGTLHPYGYYYISVYGKKYRSARLAWFYMYGEMPNVIDHINGDTKDDRINNLRNVTCNINSKNCKKSKNNTSGITGVVWCKKLKKWCVKIKVEYLPIHLGYYHDIIEAIYSRWIAENIYDFHPAHGRR